MELWQSKNFEKYLPWYFGAIKPEVTYDWPKMKKL